MSFYGVQRIVFWEEEGFFFCGLEFFLPLLFNFDGCAYDIFGGVLSFFLGTMMIFLLWFLFGVVRVRCHDK